MADPTTETKPAEKPPMKSFEEAASDFMKQAAANEYGTGGEPEATPAAAKEPAAKPAKEAPKSEERKPESTDLRRAPDAVFQKADEKKPEEKKEAESEIDKLPKPEFKDAATSAQWDELRAKAKSEVGEYKAKINELNGRLGHVAKLENKIKEQDAKIAEMSALVERANVEAHPDFRKKYVEGRDALVDRAKRIVADAGGEGDDIALALSLQGKARVEAIEKAAGELSTFQQGRLAKVIDELENLDAEAAEKRARSGDSWKEIQKEQQERAAREQEEFTARAIKDYETVKRDMARELEVLREVDGYEWWNEQRKKIFENADRFFQQNEDVREAGKAAIWKEAGPVYRDLYMDERKHSEKIEKELADTKKALEEAYGGSPRAAGALGDGGVKSLKNMTFEERAAHHQATGE